MDRESWKWPQRKSQQAVGPKFEKLRVWQRHRFRHQAASPALCQRSWSFKCRGWYLQIYCYWIFSFLILFVNLSSGIQPHRGGFSETSSCHLGRLVMLQTLLDQRPLKVSSLVNTLASNLGLEHNAHLDERIEEYVAGFWLCIVMFLSISAAEVSCYTLAIPWYSPLSSCQGSLSARRWDLRSGPESPKGYECHECQVCSWIASNLGRLAISSDPNWADQGRSSFNPSRWRCSILCRIRFERLHDVQG